MDKKTDVAYTDMSGRSINQGAGAVSSDTKEKGTTAGKGLGLAGKESTGLPKQSDYPTTEAWAAAMRKYREMQAEAKERALK